MNALRTALAGLALTVALAGCMSAAAPSASPSAAAPTDPPPTAVPGGGSGSPDPGVIGGGGGSNPGPGGQPALAQPKPGTTIDPHPVSIETLEAQIDGRRVVVLATWTSGVEPCYVLDTVTVEQAGNEFTISMTEGSSEAGAMCIEIAQQHATGIDLGELEPGEYRVRAKDGGLAAPIEFSVG